MSQSVTTIMGKRILLLTRKGRRRQEMGKIQQTFRRNPVALYQLYKSKRPEQMLRPDAPFYIAIMADTQKLYTAGVDINLGQKWYKNQRLGINMIYQFMKSMKGDGELSSDKRLTNHSTRKHLIQKLTNANIPPNQIVQISGHRNINSLNNYSHINPGQQRDISRILSNEEPMPSTSAAGDDMPLCRRIRHLFQFNLPAQHHHIIEWTLQDLCRASSGPAR